MNRISALIKETIKTILGFELIEDTAKQKEVSQTPYLPATGIEILVIVVVHIFF